MTATGAVERPAGAADFDFIQGDWLVGHRKLARRLAGSADWQIFLGAVRATPILAGLGNFDENVIEDPAGTYEALTVRTFDPGTGQWTIHWIDGRDPTPDAPMRGRFADGVGTFTGHDIFEGRPILIRFVWSDITADGARWEQAFSADGGASWEINWQMQFRRAGTWEE